MSKYIGTPVVNVSVDTVDVTGDITTTDTTPEVIIVNNTHEDTDGGREGKVTFKGQQSGGEETTLAQIQASHDGTSDDEKGDLIFKTNDGSDGASPTERMRIDSAGTTSITVTGNEDTLNLISTDADATKGPILNLYRNSASPADSDATGRINFQGENSAGETITYAQAFSSILDVTDGTEDGRYKIGTMVAGSFDSRMDMTNTETVFNEDSKDLDFRVESDGNANMFVVGGENGQVGIGRAPTSTYKLDVHEELSGNWLAHIHNSHATNGYGVKIRAGDDNNVSAFRVSSQDNATTILECTGGGIVTKPNQPSFAAYVQNNSVYDANSVGNAYVNYDAELYDTGNNHSAGIFTAPVAGVYYFRAEAYTNAFVTQSWFIVNGSRTNASDTVYTGDDEFSGNSTILKLAANDTVGFHPYRSGNSSMTVNANANHSWFRGMLIG